MALCWGAPVWAQSTSASLIGTLRSDSDKTVADAVIQLRSHDTGRVRATVTDESGHYRVDLLAPGTWTVSARLPNGQLSQSEVVELHLQQTVRLDFKVEAGIEERVVVRAEAPLVDRKETAGKLTVTGERANRLPISGRVFTDLALLDSSVGSAAPGNFFGERGSVFVVNGQSGRSNSFSVDGLDNNDHASGTTSNTNFSQLAIAEFVLLTHQYSPEFGRASGGSLNIVTQRGGNQFSWEAFAQGTGSDWNSTGDFVSNLPDAGVGQEASRRNAAGFSLGGPLKKDRAFFFVAYERQRSDDVIPYTGVTRDGVEGGRVSAPSRDDFFFTRMDFNLGDQHTLMLRLTADDRATSGVNVGGVFTPESGFRIDERDLDFAGHWTAIISPRLISEFRFLAAKSTFEQHANSDRPGVSRPSGVFGGNNLNLQLRNEQRFQLIENLTYQRARHTIKLGLDIARSNTDVTTGFNPNGNFGYNSDFEFNPGASGDLILSCIRDAEANGTWPFIACRGFDEPHELGNILSYPELYQLIRGQPRAQLVDTKIALFFQDRWNVGPRLLLDYGLRYDLSTFTLPEDASVESSVPNGGAKRDYDNLAPRFGFTFTPRPNGKLVIRGGAGVFYDKMVLGFPAVSSITSGTEILLSFPQGFTYEVTEETVEADGVDNTGLLFLPTLVTRFSTATELETPYTVQFNLGIERTLGRNSAIRANLLRSRGYHLPLMRDLNPNIGVVRPGFDSCPDQPQPFGTTGIPCHRNDQTVGSIIALSSDGRSWYTGLDLAYKWQADDGWFSASYTLSKSEDTGFDPLKGGISVPPNSDSIETERGRSDADRRHKLVLSGELGLQLWGLRASAVVQLSTGLPYNVTTGSDDNLDGLYTDRPKGVGRNTGKDTDLEAINSLRATANRYRPVDDQLADIHSLDEPYFAQVDLRLSRPFTFRDSRGSAELFLQIINLLDRENAGLIEGRAISQQFGQPVTLAGPPRILELGLRIGY